MRLPNYLLAGAFLIALTACHTTNQSTSEKGFEPIFDGRSLTGWEGDTTYWHVENGILTGIVTPQTLLKRNSFIIWRGGKPADFELKVEYRVSSAGNSGVNYRSVVLDSLPYALKGYQADIDGFDPAIGRPYSRYSGQNYEERGRTFLAMRGQKVVIEDGKKPIVTDSTGNLIALNQHIHQRDWNQLHIIAKGNHLQHYINGVLMADVTDNDAAHRTMSGLIGVQVHVGPPMKIEYRNFLLKRL